MLQQLLGVEAVWCDTRSEDSSQQFVLWVGAVLELRHQFESALQGRSFAFSLLAHSDQNSPMLDFLASSSVLQARRRLGWGGVGWVGAVRGEGPQAASSKGIAALHAGPDGRMGRTAQR